MADGGFEIGDAQAAAAAHASDAYLGVARSLSGRQWLRRSHCERTALAIAQRYGAPAPAAQAAAARGVSLETYPAFVAPRLRDAMPDPHALMDMAKAADRIARAVLASEQIAVFGDYDVDGSSAAALLYNFFSALGAKVDVYIPDRSEGYGPSTAAFETLRARGAGLIVTVDCGSSAAEQIAGSQAAGVPVLLTPHHQIGALPPAFAVVNPHRADDASGLDMLTAAGLAFLVAVAAARRLREAGFFADRPEPELIGLLDLAALGTVCDVAPLIGLNRAIVMQGLKVLSRRRNAGLAALCAAAGIEGDVSVQHVGFQLGPRLNAAGRLGEARLSLELMTSDDPQRAERLARRLSSLNEERREIENAVFDEALPQAERQAAEGAEALIVVGDGWPAGVVGVVAGRLKERFLKPAVVVGFETDELGAGSGRSVIGVDLGAAIGAAAEAGVLEKGGGHAMAAGLTVRRERLKDFAAFLNHRLSAGAPRAQPERILEIDACVSARGASMELWRALEQAGPFGAGNPEPVVALSDMRIERVQVAGERHVSVTAIDSSGGRLRAIAFRAVGAPLGDALLRHDGRKLHLAGVLAPDSWRGGDAVQLRIVDAALSSRSPA